MANQWSNRKTTVHTLLASQIGGPKAQSLTQDLQ